MEIEKEIGKLFGEITKSKKLQNIVLPIVDKISQKCFSHPFEFKLSHSEDERAIIYDELRQKNPRKLPIVVEFADDSKKKPKKLLVDYDEYVLRLIATIKKEVTHKEAIFVLTDTNRSLMGSDTLGESYRTYPADKMGNSKELKDKIMYLVVYKENTFGK